MILPGSYTAALILLVAGMLGSGLWANLFKAAGGKWRFELFYFDFAIGLLVASAIIALTAGSLGFDGFSFSDDLRLAGKRHDLWAFAAGTIFNLGNMLLLSAVSITGMALAFPAGMGCALIVAALWNFALNPGGNTALTLVGVIVLVGAIVFAVLSYRSWSAAVVLRAQAEGATAKPRRRKSSSKAVLLSLAGGVMLGSFALLIQMGSAGENGLGPYSLGFIFAIGVVFSTFVFNLFFMNLPVQGKPVEIRDYFRANLPRHALGVLGGAIWYVGLIASLIAARAEGAAHVGPKVGYALEQGGVVIAALCGLFLWREYQGGDGSVRVRVGLMFVLLMAGIGVMTAGVAVAR